jgi:hypothetical protein
MVFSELIFLAKSMQSNILDTLIFLCLGQLYLKCGEGRKLFPNWTCEGEHSERKLFPNLNCEEGHWERKLFPTPGSFPSALLGEAGI